MVSLFNQSRFFGSVEEVDGVVVAEGEAAIVTAVVVAADDTVLAVVACAEVVVDFAAGSADRELVVQ